MERLLLTVVMVGLIHIVHGQFVPYDCRRVNQICSSDVTGGRCNRLTGSCNCTNLAFTGFDCTLPAAQVQIAPACTVDCQGRGTCYDDGSGAGSQCYCDASYYGDRCQFDRVAVECFGDYMLVRVFPHNFVGEVFLSGLPPNVEPQCEFDVAPDGNGLFKNLSLIEERAVNPCASTLSVSTNGADGTLIFTYEVMVKYSPLYTSFVDEAHLITCRHTLNGPLIGVVVEVDGAPFDGAIIEGNSTVLSLDITRKSDRVSVVTNNIVTAIGEDLFIEVTLDKTSRYENHKVENCGAYSHPLDLTVNPDRKEKTMLSGGCPPKDALDVITGALTKTDITIFIPFKAFKFSTGELHIYCSVRVCQSATDPLCLPNDCTNQFGGPGTGYGRKKREADDSSLERVASSLFVVAKLQSSTGGFTERIVERSCFKSVAFLSVTGVLAFLLLFTLIVTIFLWVKYSRNNKEQAKGKYSDTA